MEIGIPMLVSSRGYGMLWDNPAITDVEPASKARRMCCAGSRRPARRSITTSCMDPRRTMSSPPTVKLTGAAPLLGKWVWGFWQCKERYSTQEEDARNRFAIPRGPYCPSMASCRIGSIWKPGGDPTRYPDPKGMVELHPQNACAHPDLGVGAIRSRTPPNGRNWRRPARFTLP